MDQDYVTEAIGLLKDLQQQSKSAMATLQIRQSDVDELDAEHQAIIESSEKIKSDLQEVQKSSADMRQKFDEKLYEEAKQLEVQQFSSGDQMAKVKQKPLSAVENVEKIRFVKKNVEHIKRQGHSQTRGGKGQENNAKLASIPQMKSASAKELLSVRTRGKMSLPELNAIIAEMNRILKEKHDLLRRPKHGLNKTDDRRVDHWESQLKENPDLKDQFFISEPEVLSLLPPKLKAQFRIARLCLTALKRLEVIQQKEATFFIIS